MKVYVKKHIPQDARLAAFAHDIRTPMCCVAGAAQMALASSRAGRDVSEQVEQILLAVGAMDDMLSRLCGDAPKRSSFTGDRLTRELLALVGAAARAKDHALSMDLSALGARRYLADRTALVRILSNLLHNAVKYTPPGGLVRLWAARGEGDVFCFFVADNGMGMKPEFLSRLFVPFERAKESAHLPGTGLGLTIAKRLCGRMGGCISVSSDWGRGTTFEVRVPLEPQAE